jgi:hypothetical protein
MEYPLEDSIEASVKPSKASTALKRTISPVLRPCPGSVTVIIEEPLPEDLKALNLSKTSTAGSVLSGLASRKACGSAGVFRTIN